jgi:hypothetical protein
MRNKRRTSRRGTAAILAASSRIRLRHRASDIVYGVAPALLALLVAVPLLCAALVFAGWSISWQGEYLERQTAVWTVAERLVAQGIAPTEIDAGYEWAGWTRADGVITEARAAALSDGSPRGFVQRVVDGLYEPKSWYVGFGPLGRGCAGRLASEVPCGKGQTAYGLRRCQRPGGPAPAATAP